MRYLQSKSVFENWQNVSTKSEVLDIIEYLRDIFLEVEDDGFNVDIDTLTSLYNWGHVYAVTIYKSESPLVSSPDESIRFKIKDVLETILTSESYMKSLGYKINHIQSMEVGCGGSGIGYGLQTISMLSREKRLLTTLQRTAIQRMVSKETFYLKIEFTKE
jgi:hypothetical protein